MEGNCLAEYILYQANTEIKDNVKSDNIYIGATANEWKKDTITISLVLNTVNMVM